MYTFIFGYILIWINHIVHAMLASKKPNLASAILLFGGSRYVVCFDIFWSDRGTAAELVVEFLWGAESAKPNKQKEN